jgi:hypothetical protein
MGVGVSVGVLVEVGDGVIGVAVWVEVEVAVPVGAMITAVGVATCNASLDREVNSLGAKTRDGEALPTT